MKNEILIELAARWEREAEEPETINGSPEAETHNAFSRGCRETKRECADTIRTLVDLLG